MTTHNTYTLMSLILICFMLNIDASKTVGAGKEYLINTTYTPIKYTSIEGQTGFITVKNIEYVNTSSTCIDNMIITVEPKIDNLFIFIIYLYINFFIFIFIFIYFINSKINDDKINDSLIDDQTDDDQNDNDEIYASIDNIDVMIKRLKADKSASLIQALFKGVYFRSNVLPIVIEKHQITQKMIDYIVRQEMITTYQKMVISANNNTLNSLVQIW